MSDVERMRALFRRFARDAAGASPIYEGLSRSIADAPDGRVAALLLAAPDTQRNPAVVFAAVHHLLLQGARHALAEFYPSCGGDRTDDPARAFSDFCVEHAAAVRALIATRNTQTNEAARSAYLLPAIVARASGPIALIELGTSTGLLLNLDRYRYDFGTAGSAGDPDAIVRVAPDVSGSPPCAIPDVVARAGIDVVPVDVRDDNAVAWVRACIWPEQLDRAERFARAIDVARAHPVRLIAGDAARALPEVAATMTPDATLVVVHTIFTQYLSPASFAAITEAVKRVSLTREVVWIAAEGRRTVARLFALDVPERDHAVAIAAARVSDGELRDAQLLGFAGYHGQWLEWLAV